MAEVLHRKLPIKPESISGLTYLPLSDTAFLCGEHGKVFVLNVFDGQILLEQGSVSRLVSSN